MASDRALPIHPKPTNPEPSIKMTVHPELQETESEKGKSATIEPPREKPSLVEYTKLVPTPIPEMGLDPNRYLFERNRLHLPFYLAVLVPKEVHNALDELRIAASEAFHAFKIVEKYAAQCFYRLCDPLDKVHAEKHWTSMNLLFSYKLPDDAENPTLGTGAGIPQTLLNFHVDVDSYREYEAGFGSLKYHFLAGPYDIYLDSREHLQQILATCEVSKMDMVVWRKWLNDFLEEMRKWEDKIHDVKVPSLDDILWEGIEMIVEKVDFGDIPPHIFDQSASDAGEEEYNPFSAR
ncbi:hypothetical protein FQN54_000798 [Arachnomyces sp. PD_36]|nr:hypothetical protein FQN54_000798 [Arachnomyces sp. PD_36]